MTIKGGVIPWWSVGPKRNGWRAVAFTWFGVQLIGTSPWDAFRHWWPFMLRG